jgi:hypothetical protein
MADLKEQCICVKFCFKLGKAASQMHERIKTALGDNANVLPMSEESEASQAKHQEHVGYLFFTVRALFTRNLFLQAKR